MCALPASHCSFRSSFVALACVTSSVSAQTVSPQSVEFDPSPDHDRSVGGVNVVDRYELRFYAVGGSTAAPGHRHRQAGSGSGRRHPLQLLVASWHLDGQRHHLRSARGRGWTRWQHPQRDFEPVHLSHCYSTAGAAPPPCVYAIATTSRSGGAGSTTGTVGVTAGSGCAWTAASDSAWLDVTGGASGSANGTVSYSVDANPTTAQRIGRLTIAGKTFTFTQAGATCAYSVSPASRSVTAASGSVSVTAGTGCAWTAAVRELADRLEWRQRIGNGTISYNVAANTASARTATLSVGTHLQRDAERHCSYASTTHDGYGCCRDGISHGHGRQRLLADGVELGVVVDHHLWRHRFGERNGQLQHRRQLVIRGTLGDVDSRLGDVQRDAERVLQLHHFADEPCVQCIERDEQRHRSRCGRLFVDRDALRNLDNHQQRRQRQRQRHRELQRCRLHGIIVAGLARSPSAVRR